MVPSPPSDEPPWNVSPSSSSGVAMLSKISGTGSFKSLACKSTWRTALSAACARLANSRSSCVLPTPGMPSMSAMPQRSPRRTSPRCASSAASSAVRPAKYTGLLRSNPSVVRNMAKRRSVCLQIPSANGTHLNTCAEFA